MDRAFKIDLSPSDELDAFILEGTKVKNSDYKNCKTVVVGGGTGSVASIEALKQLNTQISVVVSMADDGGSTGILRQMGNVTAPGDIKKCMCALAKDQKSPLTEIFKYRISKLDNHALGNLILSALELSSGSFTEAIKICENLLDCQGHIYPSTLEHINLVATTTGGETIVGQSSATNSKCPLKKVKIVNEQGHAPKAYSGAVRAIKNADLIILGPGSLFTSIIPNIALEEILNAIKDSSACVVFVCNILDCEGETQGLSALEHVIALNNHGLLGKIDFAILHSEQFYIDDFLTNSHEIKEYELKEHNSSFNRNQENSKSEFSAVKLSKDDLGKIESFGTRVIVKNFSYAQHREWHNIHELKCIFEKILRTNTSFHE